MPKISIIVPVYNVEQYLENCIKSILNQTFEDIEIILVDDGSTDNSGRICDSYKGKDKRIKVIHKKNGGLSSARNCGIEMASGKYIGLVDSDDYIHPKMYEILYKNAIKYSSDIVVGSYKSVDNMDDSDIYNDVKIDGEIQNYTSIEALEELYNENDLDFIISWTKLYKKCLFDDLKYEVGRIYEDQFIIHKILYKSKIVTYVPALLYFYQQREGSIMHSKFSIKNLDSIYYKKDRADFYREVGLKKLTHLAEFKYINGLFYEYFKAKNELDNIDRELKNLRKDFKDRLRILLKNPMYNKKEKLLWIAFCIHPYFYELYENIKSRKLKIGKGENINAG